MSENEKKEGAVNTIDYDKIVSSINSQLKEGFEGLSTKLAEKAPKKEEETFVWPHEEQDPDSEDVPITKAQLKAVVQKIKEDNEKTSAQITSKILNEQTQRITRDQEAVQHFPMLDSKSEHFDKEFVEAVDTEMKKRIQRGRSQSDLDLLYDAAASVKATSTKWNKSTTEKLLEENRRFNNSQADFSVRGKSKDNSGKPTDHQIELAAKFNMSKENLEKYMKRQH